MAPSLASFTPLRGGPLGLPAIELQLSSQCPVLLLFLLNGDHFPTCYVISFLTILAVYYVSLHLNPGLQGPRFVSILSADVFRVPRQHLAYSVQSRNVCTVTGQHYHRPGLWPGTSFFNSLRLSFLNCKKAEVPASWCR